MILPQRNYYSNKNIILPFSSLEMSACVVITPIRSEATKKLYEKYLSKMKEANLNPLEPQKVLDWVKSLAVGNSSKKGYLAVLKTRILRYCKNIL